MSDIELYDKLPWHHKLAINVVRCGTVPRHIGYIMDGNRRFAKKNKINKESGISSGFKRFSIVMKWSLLLGIKYMTVYAFSIENFKRSQSEIDFTFELFESYCKLFLDNIDFYLRNGIRINIIGDTSLLPQSLHIACAKLMLATKMCTVFQCNICLAYTSKEEMYSTIKLLIHGVENNEIDVDDINEILFTRCLYTRESPEVDLVIRTSGACRLSDFLLWQTTSSTIIFVQTFWPSIKLWEIIYQIISYQRNPLRNQVFKSVSKISSYLNYDRFSREQLFLDKLTVQMKKKIELILRSATKPNDRINI